MLNGCQLPVPRAPSTVPGARCPVPDSYITLLDPGQFTPTSTGERVLVQVDSGTAGNAARSLSVFLLFPLGAQETCSVLGCFSGDNEGIISVHT